MVANIFIIIINAISFNCIIIEILTKDITVQLKNLHIGEMIFSVIYGAINVTIFKDCVSELHKNLKLRIEE